MRMPSPTCASAGKTRCCARDGPDPHRIVHCVADVGWAEIRNAQIQIALQCQREIEEGIGAPERCTSVNVQIGRRNAPLCTSPISSINSASRPCPNPNATRCAGNLS